MHVCRASFGGLWTFDADRYVVAALHNVPKAYADFLRTTTVVPGPGSAPYRFLHGERSVIQNIDLAGREAAIRAARDAAEAALERQTATADILKVIASSPTDVQPVLDAVAKAAMRFCGATMPRFICVMATA